jgi:hypothetical protein
MSGFAEMRDSEQHERRQFSQGAYARERGDWQ